MNEIMERLSIHKDTITKLYPSNEFFYLGLYGSQNYGLNTEKSDIDSKCILLPTPQQVILGGSAPNAEVAVGDELSTVKDIRGMFQNFYKGNINFVEILFTPYALGSTIYFDQIKLLRDNAEMIATRDIPNLFRMAQGMAQQKYIAFDKPFASKADVLKAYGYDPKQLHHIARLYYFLDFFIKGGSFREALTPPPTIAENLLALKIDPLNVNEARAMREGMMKNLSELVERNTPKFTLPPEKQEEKNFEVKEFLDGISYQVIKDSLTETLLKNKI